MVTLLDEDQVAAIQIILGVEADGIWGPQSQGALDAITSSGESPSENGGHDTVASSFADPADVRAFKKCKAQGKTDQQCFKVGDNGVGCWNDSTVEGTGPSCALPPEVMAAWWGSKAKAKHQKVLVERQANSKQVTCILKDQMPAIKNLANDAMIDLNPDACYALDLSPPIMEPVTVWKG